MKLMNSLLTATVPLLPRWMARPFASPYVAGETIDEALQRAESVIDQGFSVTMDILGEHTPDVELAHKITEDYCSIYNLITQKNLDCTISLKLTHLGLDISEELAVENLNKIIETAKPGNRGLTIDMENSPYTSQTLDIYRTALKSYENIGTVLQAYLHRSMDDLKQIISSKLRLRICKGIYLEPEEIAHTRYRTIVAATNAAIDKMLDSSSYVAIASHDIPVIEHAVEALAQRNMGPDRDDPRESPPPERKGKGAGYEFQMLLGVRGNIRRRLAKDGHRTRIYVPYGERWYEYSMRRLDENPDVAMHIVKSIFMPWTNRR